MLPGLDFMFTTKLSSRLVNDVIQHTSSFNISRLNIGKHVTFFVLFCFVFWWSHTLFSHKFLYFSSILLTDQ